MDLEDFRPLGLPIADTWHGFRLDTYLGEKYPFHTRTKWQQVIQDGLVRINKHFIHKPAYRIKTGDQVAYFSPQSAEPEVNSGLECIWKDGDIMAVYKPTNLPMHGGGVYRQNTFARFVQEQFGENWYAVHRLDRETSGIVLCAATSELRDALSVELRKRSLQKVYLAIVKGSPTEEAWNVDAPIGELPISTHRFKQGVTPAGYPSMTKFITMGRKENMSLLEVYPKTGRTHQIRVHSAYSGFPLVGDKKYQDDESIYLEYLEKGFTPRVQDVCLVDRLCLHATAVTFKHPTKDVPVTVKCPMPEDMVRVWGE